MSRRTFRAASLLTLLLSAGAAVGVFLPGISWAQRASFTEVTEIACSDGFLGVDKFWQDDDGVQHARGWMVTDVVWARLDGDPQPLGAQSVWLDWNRDPLTGNGDFHGHFEREWTVNGVSGSFIGRVEGVWEGWNLSATSTSKGDGDFEGMTYKATFSGTWGWPCTVGPGTIHAPSGEF